MRTFVSVAAIAASIIAAPAGAESIKMTGVFPSPNPQVAVYRVLGIDNFTGREGRRMQLELERRLTKPIDGQPAYFYLVGDGGVPDAIVAGDASSEVQETPYRGEEEVCVARDPSGKCTAKAKQPVNCMRRVVDFAVDVSVTDNTSGQIVFGERYPRNNTMTWCGAQQPYATIDQTLQNMIEDIAKQFRNKTTMRSDDYSVRLKEDKDAMSGDEKKVFAAWLKQTKSDPKGACARVGDMPSGTPGSKTRIAYQYNTAVCSEFIANGNTMFVVSYYENALKEAPGDKDIIEGLARVRQLEAARAIASQRGG